MPLRILVVDDDHDNANSLVMLLGLYGHESQAAYDGLHAVSLAEAYRPDVIFMDLQMPGLDGLSAAGRIRSESWGQGIVVCALTGHADDKSRIASLGAGCLYHLVKPLDPSILRNILDRLPQKVVCNGAPDHGLRRRQVLCNDAARC